MYVRMYHIIRVSLSIIALIISTGMYQGVSARDDDTGLSKSGTGDYPKKEESEKIAEALKKAQEAAREAAKKAEEQAKEARKRASERTSEFSRSTVQKGEISTLPETKSKENILKDIPSFSNIEGILSSVKNSSDILPGNTLAVTTSEAIPTTPVTKNNDTVDGTSPLTSEEMRGEKPKDTPKIENKKSGDGPVVANTLESNINSSKNSTSNESKSGKTMTNSTPVNAIQKSNQTHTKTNTESRTPVSEEGTSVSNGNKNITSNIGPTSVSTSQKAPNPKLLAPKKITPGSVLSPLPSKSNGQEKVKGELNQLILNSYKAQGDKLIRELEVKIQKNISQESKRIEAYKKVCDALEDRKARLSTSEPNPVKRKIMEDFLTHIIQNIEKKHEGN